jgi:hypothetical protein
LAITLLAADTYVQLNVIDIEDWITSDEERKVRILNVAKRTIDVKFQSYIEDNPDFIIPDEAVYEFCPILALLFNDQNKHMLNGVSQLSATGIASLMFKQDSIKTPGEYSLADFIPQSALNMIGSANGIKIGGKRVKWTVI